MTKKRLDKKLIFLEPSFKDILVCRSKEIRPYLEIFVTEPENISQESLGTLFGILEINDTSEDSSYIVNYLISIIKKEYFANIRRGPIESFEAALHRANLALAKLAEHENIGWIGHLHSVCAVVEKNNIHLSQTGTASAYLLRSKSLVNISGEEEGEKDLNPLKTFQEVVSGRMEDQDKIILTTDGLFNIFSLEEIKRSAIKFSQNDFTQFLHTALINEMDRAAVLVIDMKEKEEGEEADISRKNRTVNAFSQDAFAKKAESKPHNPPPEERTEMIAELKKELEKSQDGFVDEKTGHIYIKDDEYSAGAKNPTEGKNYFSNFYQKMSSSGSSLAKNAQDIYQAKLSSLSAEKNNQPPADSADDIDRIRPRKSFSEIVAPIGHGLSAVGHNLPVIGRKITAFFSAAFFYTKSFIVHRIVPLAKRMARQVKNTTVRIISWLAGQYRSIVKDRQKMKKESTYPSSTLEPSANHRYEPEDLSPTREEKREWFGRLAGKPNSLPANRISAENINADIRQPNFSAAPAERITPSFSRLKDIFGRLDRTKKIYGLVVVVLLIVVPFVILKWENKPVPTKEVSVAAPAPEIIPLESDKNVSRITNIDPVIAGANIISPINVNGKIFAVEADQIVSAEDNKSYPLPDEFKNSNLVFEMDDLNLILLLKDKKILTFSASARKFAPNNISIPENAVIPASQSLLTYAYLLDTKNNQIYRYPRAEGGFGEKTNWLKDAADFSSAKAMAVNENIYITDGQNIWKFLRGKKQDFAVEQTATPLSIDRLYTKQDSQNLYVLDKTNSRIIKLGVDGNILAQYYQPEISQTANFTVDEAAQKIYITSESGMRSFRMD